MDAEILRTPPTSGEFTEVRFDAIDDCTWVRFDADESWVGVFGHGAFGSSAAVATSESDETAFVVAGGQGYLLDGSTREVVHLSECDYLKSVIAAPERSLYVACSDTDLFAYAKSGLLWRSSRVSVDGVRLTNASTDRVEGEVFDLARWVPFVLSVSTWEFRCEWDCPFD